MRAVAIPGWMDKCCGCHACYAICPKAAIEMEYQADGFLYPKINEKLCVNCGLCSSVSPISVTREKTALLRVISGRAADSMIVRQSSSGGFFKLLAEKVLAAGGVVYGAVFDAEKKEVLCLSTDRTALANLMRSKYVQSRIGSAYKEVELALLEDREVLFSGTPCQIRGLLQYLKLHNVSGKLRTVDFICHGVPSPQYFQEFLGDIERRSKAQVTDVTFREKDKGWHTQVTKVYLSSGKTWSRESLNHPYYYYFLNDYSLRNSCYSCEEYCAHTSDLTLADDWLSSREKDDDGMSLVYVNTKMGEAMLEEIQSEIEYADVTSERTNMEVYAHDRYDRGKKKIWMNAWRGRGYPYVSGRMFHKLYVRKWLCRNVYRLLTGIYRRFKKEASGGRVRLRAKK